MKGRALGLAALLLMLCACTPRDKLGVPLPTPEPLPAYTVLIPSDSDLLPEPSPEPSPASSPAPSPDPGKGPGVPLRGPTGAEAMARFGGLYLNEAEERAAMGEETGVRDSRSEAVRLYSAGARFAAIYPCEHGAFYAAYDESLRRTGCFYLPEGRYGGCAVRQSAPRADGGWRFLLTGWPLAEVEEGTARAAGFAAEEFGETVDLLCTVSPTGEMRAQHCVAPEGRMDSVTSEDICWMEGADGESFLVDLRANAVLDVGEALLDGGLRYIGRETAIWQVGSVSREDLSIDHILAGGAPDGGERWRLQLPFGQDSIGRTADGLLYITDTYLEEFEFYGGHYDAPVYFVRAGEEPVLAYEAGEVYAALDGALEAMQADGFFFGAPGGYELEFLTPTRFRAVFRPYCGYRGGGEEAYVNVQDYLCVLDVEMPK